MGVVGNQVSRNRVKYNIVGVDCQFHPTQLISAAVGTFMDHRRVSVCRSHTSPIRVYLPKVSGFVCALRRSVQRENPTIGVDDMRVVIGRFDSEGGISMVYACSFYRSSPIPFKIGGHPDPTFLKRFPARLLR